MICVVSGLSSSSTQPRQLFPLQTVKVYCQIVPSWCCWYKEPPAAMKDVLGLSSIFSQPTQEFPLQAGPKYCQIEPSLCCSNTPIAPTAKLAVVLGLLSSSSQPE